MEAPALLLIDFWRLPSTDVLTKRTDNLSSRTLVNNSDVYEDFQNGSWYLELQAFIFLPSALGNHPDTVGVPIAWVQMFGSNLRNGAAIELAQTTWARKFQNQRPTNECWKQMIKCMTRQQGGRSNNSENKDPTGAWGTIPPRWGQSKTRVENTRGQLRLRA